MPHFVCTDCERRVHSPVVIGHGDCPHCGGDVIFDIRGDHAHSDNRDERPPARPPLLRRLLGLRGQ
jgi:DNA-directed RNA polymerase subunit RPC12/RpoP